MAKKNSAVMQRLVKKRSQVFDQLSFNERYPAVYSAQLDEQNARALKLRENEMKRRLLPLELAAVPAAEANAWRVGRAMESAEEKQRLKRRAAEQAYKRAAEKGGEAQAAAVRRAKLEALDRALADRRTKLEAQYPLNDAAQPSAGAIAKYEEATRKEEAALAAFRAEQESKKARAMEKLQNELEGKNQKLRAEFETCCRQVDALAKISEEDFGKDTILSIRNLKMYFSGVKAVDDISFDIRQGEIFGLIGPNGAGKTTIFNCVTQFYHPTGGSVFYRDRFGSIVDLTEYKTHNVIKTGIARTFQNLELVFGLNVLDNLLVGAHSLYRSTLVEQLLHTPRLNNEERVNRARAEEILERLELSAYKDMYVQGLPYGVLKKVELARTLMTNPRIIILDEPAAGLNDSETAELAETIRKIRDDFHCTIFLVEHDMNLVMKLCDTVCVCSFGKRLAIGSPREIQSNPLVQEAYLGSDKEDA